MKTIIIAEAGVNHNGKIKIAKKLIEVAADSGADYVKFQSFKAERLVTSSAPKADYQKENTSPYESQLNMLKKIELKIEDYVELLAYSKECGIKIFSTAFDVYFVDQLQNLGQDVFKIPSGEITNLPLLRRIGGLRKRVLLSTGMSDLTEVESALNIIINCGTSKNEVTVLHCTSAYPAPFQDLNLRAIEGMKKKLGVNIGYSDHSIGIAAPIAAVSIGATVIEKHFTLNKKLPGPDHKASLNPRELKSMVSAIRNIEAALGNDEKIVTPSEINNRMIARKSIVASKIILKGDFFTEENLTTKRPGTGISPMLWYEIIGTRASKNYYKDEAISL